MQTTSFNDINTEAGTPADATLTLPVDEINLERIDESATKVYKIKGEFKDPKKKPWLENEHEAF